jgi:hypothetical protein
MLRLAAVSDFKHHRASHPQKNCLKHGTLRREEAWARPLIHPPTTTVPSRGDWSIVEHPAQSDCLYVEAHELATSILAFINACFGKGAS